MSGETPSAGAMWTGAFALPRQVKKAKALPCDLLVPQVPRAQLPRDGLEMRLDLAAVSQSP